MRSRIEALYREESRRVLATLIRLLGDFELAEEALHDAFIAAVEQWPRDGIPRNPRAWLPLGASRPSTTCAGERASTPRSGCSPSNWKSRPRRRRRRAMRWKTTGYA